MSARYKTVQTIYAEAGFAPLLDLISGYLSSARWYTGEDPEDSLRRRPAQQRWQSEKREGKVALVLYAARQHYSMLGSGILLRILHVRRFVQEGTQPISTIPMDIRLRLDHLPNVVEVETHNWWSMDGSNLAYTLALRLSDYGHRTYMVSCLMKWFGQRGTLCSTSKNALNGWRGSSNLPCVSTTDRRLRKHWCERNFLMCGRIFLGRRGAFS